MSSSQPRNHSKEEDNERLRSDNVRLGSTINELQLEISYYKGELKRLEWEKNLLKQDVTKMSSLFKGWLAELQGSNTRSIIEDVDYFTNMVLNPALPMQKVLEMQDTLLLLTSCQPPFFIEYTTKAWSQACGWESNEVLGYTCAFLQGECTDLKVAAAFTKDVKEVGYGTMRINNYRKNGELFTATVIVFPVYDTVEPTGEETENPVLTHFATMLTQIQTLKHEEVEPVIPTSISNGGLGTSAKNHHVRTEMSYDRRQNCRKYDIEYALTLDSFKDISTTVRLSDLLRLMLCSSEAMVLYDTHDRIVHTNKAYTRMTGYSLSDVEGKNNYEILQGPLTDILAIQRCVMTCRKQEQVMSVTVTNYRKDGLLFHNLMTIAPVRGGHLNQDVTHYCALMQEVTGAMMLEDPLTSIIHPTHPINTMTLDTTFSKRDRESREAGQTRGSDSDDAPSKPTNRATILTRDVNYFACEEEDDDEEDQDVTMKYTPISTNPMSLSSSTSHVLPPPPLHVTHVNHQQEQTMEMDQDNQTIDTRHYSMASGVTDRSDYSNSSGTTLVEKYKYKDGGRKMRPTRESNNINNNHNNKKDKKTSSNLNKDPIEKYHLDKHHNDQHQSVDNMEINLSYNDHTHTIDHTTSMSSSSGKEGSSISGKGGTSMLEMERRGTNIDDCDIADMGLKMWACDQLSVESKRSKTKAIENKQKEQQQQQQQYMDLNHNQYDQSSSMNQPPMNQLPMDQSQSHLPHSVQQNSDPSPSTSSRLINALTIKLPSQLLSSSHHKQQLQQQHQSLTSNHTLGNGHSQHSTTSSSSSSGIGSVGTDDSGSHDSHGSTTRDIRDIGQRKAFLSKQSSGYSSTDTNSDFSKDGSSSANPSPHSDQEDSTNLQLLSRCTMMSAVSTTHGHSQKKHHHDHITAAGQELAAKDGQNKKYNLSMPISQNETEKGIALLTGMYIDLNMPASS